MQISETGKPAKNNQGFTLIEILIVIVIIGIASGMAVLAWGDFGSNRKIVISAEQFALYAKLLKQRAVLESRMFGIALTNDGYRTYQLDSRQQWQKLPEKGPFRDKKYPDGATVQSTVLTPDKMIRFYASGEMSAFTLIFGTEAQHCLAILKAMNNGDIQQENQDACPR